MKQIEAFVDSVYKNISGDSKEIQELKDEMRSHLLEAVNELVLEGKCEQEAIDIAVKRFGGKKEMRSIVRNLVPPRKVFAKWLLYTSLTFLLICPIISGIVFTIESKKLNESNEFASKILREIDDKPGIPIRIEGYIQSIVLKSDNIYRISLYNDKKLSSSPDVTPEYIFEKKSVLSDWIYTTNNSYGENNGTWEINIDSKNYEAAAQFIFIIGVSIYWALFAVWASVNAYYQHNLSISWILIFCLFNFIGYMFYRSEVKVIKTLIT